MLTTFRDSGIVVAHLLDEVDLVDHAVGLPAADADENALVHPVESGSCGFDLG